MSFSSNGNGNTPEITSKQPPNTPFTSNGNGNAPQDTSKQPSNKGKQITLDVLRNGQVSSKPNHTQLASPTSNRQISYASPAPSKLAQSPPTAT